MRHVYYTPGSFVDKLLPAMVNGRLVSGRAAAKRIEILAGYLSGELALLFTDAAHIVASHSNREALVGLASNPIRGITESHPSWAALIPIPETERRAGGDCLRLLVLAIALLGDKPPAGIQPSISAFDSCRDATGTALISKLTDQVVSLFTAPQKGGQELTLLTAAISNQLLLTSSQSTLLNNQARRFIALCTSSSVRPAVSPNNVVQASPVDDGSITIPIHFDPQELGPGEGDLADFLAAPDEREQGRRNERNAARRSAFLYASSLGRGTEQSLALEECQVLVDHLQDEARAALSHGDISAAGVLLAWQLMLITSRGVDEILASDLDSSLELPSFFISPESSIWRSQIIARANSRKPDSSCVLADVQSYCDFPLPESVQANLVAWRLLAGPTVSRLQEGLGDLQARSERIVRTRAAIKKLLPRATDARIRLTLPVLIHERSREPCLSLIHSGPLLGFSSAPLHYFCSNIASIIQPYADALSSIGLTTSILDGAAKQFAGADLAAVNEATISAFRLRLASNTLRSKHLASLHDRIKAYNAVIRYTAEMMGAALGHRLNNNIGAFTLAGVDRRGWGVFCDKGVGGGASIRAAVFPPFLLRQLENVRLLQKELLPEIPKELRGALKAAQEGKGPLLVMIRMFDKDSPSSDGLTIECVSPITSEDLKDAWLTDRGLPRWLLRTRLRAGLKQLGAAPHLIYLQMGHVYNGVDITGAGSVISIEEAADALREKLEQHLTRDGWAPLPMAVTNRTRLPAWTYGRALSKLPEERKEFEKKWTSDWKHRRKSEFKEYRDPTHVARRTDWVDMCIADFRSTSSDSALENVELQHHHVERWLNSLDALNLQRHIEIDYLKHLRAKVVELRSTASWSGHLPPLKFVKGPDTPPLTQHHILAGAHIEVVRRTITENLPKALPVVLGRWARLAGLLITGFSVLSQRQLEAALQVLLSGNVHPLNTDHLVLDIKVGDSSARSIRLSGAATLAYHAARSMSEPIPNLGDVLRTLCAWISGTGKEKLQTLFEVQKLAIRIHRPGSMWALYESSDRNTLSVGRTEIYQSCVIGGTLLKVTNAKSLDDISGPRPCRAPSERLDQYKAFRASVHKLREPTSTSQGLNHARYTKALQLCRNTLARDDLDESVAALVQFCETQFARRAKVRISTTYDYLTGLGVPLLCSLGDDSLFDLDEDQLEELVESVMAATPDSRKIGVASRLQSFLSFHEASLSGFDLSWFSEFKSEKGDLKRFSPQVLSEAEFLALKQVLDHLGSRQQLSAHNMLSAKVAAVLMYRLGLRSREVTHRLLSDVFLLKNKLLLHVHSTPLGLVKTRNANRLLDLNAYLPDDELELFREFFAAAAQDNPLASERKSAPLFVSTIPGETASAFDARKHIFRELLNLIRAAISVVTGLPRASLHFLRHSAATRELLRKISERMSPETLCPSDFMAIPRMLGHGRLETSILYYWHLDHFVPFLEAPLTLDQLANIQGKTSDAVKKGRQRRKEGVKASAVPAISPDTALDLTPLADALADRISVQTHDFLSFMVRVERNMRALRALRNLRCSADQIAHYLRALVELGKEVQMTFIRESGDPWVQHQLRSGALPNTLSHTEKVPRGMEMVPSRHALKSFDKIERRFSKLAATPQDEARLLLGFARRGLRGPSQRESTAVKKIGWQQLDQPSIIMDCWLLGIHYAVQANAPTGIK